jgi:hypothetical protein
MHTLNSLMARRLVAALVGALVGALLATTGVTALAQSAGTNATTGAATSAGEVEFARGVGFAQTPGQLPRTLGKGMALKEGDRLTTADGGTAIVKLQDGTRMTLRPSTEMIMQKFQYKDGAADNNMVMQLLRGGFRAITGFISKGSPNAAKVQTATATVGIRGTDFDARICGAECKAESSQLKDQNKDGAKGAPRANAVLASAKLVNTQGEIYALDGQGGKRRVVDGASVYPGDTVDTGSAGKVVLAFRDDSRLTLGSKTQFRVDTFVFDNKAPTEGRFLVSLITGSLRALTGLIGKSNNRNVGFKTPTATVGIRGTGLDLDCATSESCNIFTWLGSIDVQQNGQTAIQTLEAGQGLFVSRTGIAPLSGPTLEFLQRPDTVPVNTQQLFSAGTVLPDEEGLYVYVRDGHIEVISSKETLQLGRGETGFASSDGRTGRPLEMPLFIQFDQTPMPNTPNPALLSITGEINRAIGNQCR